MLVVNLHVAAQKVGLVGQETWYGLPAQITKERLGIDWTGLARLRQFEWHRNPLSWRLLLTLT
jgi:hypothetical protein